MSIYTGSEGRSRHSSKVALSPTLSETIATYDGIAHEYGLRFAEADLTVDRLRFQKSLLPKAEILDAGCGAGRDCRLFLRDGYRPLGIDLSHGLLGEARRVTSAPLVVGDIRDLPFANESFDGVWCCAVLVHLDPADTALALREMHRVLAPAGPVFIAVRHGGGTSWRVDGPGLRRWFCSYSAEAIASLISGAGFIDLQTTISPGLASPGKWVHTHARKG